VSNLKNNFDLIAILVLVVIFGLGPATRMRTRIGRADWQHSPARLRMLPISRLLHHIPTR